MKIKTTLENIKNYKIYLQVETAVHKFLQKKGYQKLDLPVLAPALIPESYLEIFETEFRYLNKKQKLYLTPSPEIFLKRLLVSGIGDCYYLGKSFRNSEPNSNYHLPEYTMLEFYKIGGTYMEVADEILKLFQFIISKLTSLGVNELKYQNKIISLNKWEKFTVAEAFGKYTDISEKELFNQKFFI